MKTRIISGIVLAVITFGFIYAGMFVSSVFICAYLMAAAAIATYELVKNAAGVKSRPAIVVSVTFSALFTFMILGYRRVALLLGASNEVIAKRLSILELLCAAYVFFVVCIILACHKEFDLAKILTVSCAVPIMTFAFCFIGGIMNTAYGVYYILLLLVFSCGCDMGAYFTGVAFGKHKLCPEISPKKTVEGAVGGVVTAIVLAVVVMLIFRGHIDLTAKQAIATAVLTIPLCIIGMLGDLFASAVKRSVGIKDYGNLIPGHGGVLDRFDSILLISPVLFVLISLGVI